jgi:hypothetical protein
METAAGSSSAEAYTLGAFAGMLRIEGLALPPHRIEEAVAGYQGFAEGLAQLRSIPLPFLVASPEPADANRWIEQGGDDE